MHSARGSSFISFLCARSLACPESGSCLSEEWPALAYVDDVTIDGPAVLYFMPLNPFSSVLRYSSNQYTQKLLLIDLNLGTLVRSTTDGAGRTQLSVQTQATCGIDWLAHLLPKPNQEDICIAPQLTSMSLQSKDDKDEHASASTARAPSVCALGEGLVCGSSAVGWRCGARACQPRYQCWHHVRPLIVTTATG